MKLNLWLIANQLADYDIETKITAATERTISGPLPVAAIGSLYVRDEGSDVVCQSEQGTIIIHDMEEKEGFLLIQSIFNWYDSWLESIDRALQTSDYRLFVHLCAQAFSNPVMLQDSSSLLLGMDTRGIPISGIPEWRHIHETEQSSVAHYLTMSDAVRNPMYRYSDCVCRFNTLSKDERGAGYRTSGLHVNFRYQSHDYAQMTVLDKKRPLNPGDVALMLLLAQKSPLMFALADTESISSANLRVMSDLLEYREVSKEQLRYHYSIITRKSQDKDSKLCLFLFRSVSSENNSAVIDLLNTLLSRQYPTLYSWLYRGDLLFIVYVPEPGILIQQMHSFLFEQGYAGKLRIGISLPFDDLQELPYHYEQAAFAVDTVRSAELCYFYDCAYRYLLESKDIRHKIIACEPACRKLWVEDPDRREFLLTLSVYLGAERSSSLAADRLFIHRNTINYRVKYMKDYAGWDYEDTALRDYLRLSIFYLMSGEEN